MSGDPDRDLGLRDRDLTAAQREARDARLAEDAEARDDHEFGLGLFERMQALPEPPVRTVPRRARSRSPRSWWPMASVGLALAAAALLSVRTPGDGVRDRGVATGGGPSVELAAVARGPDGTLRTLAAGGVVYPDEQVLFRITTGRGGELVLAEDGVPIHPVRGVWEVGPGRHSPGGDRVLGFRTDAGQGLHRYVARLCTTPADCVESELGLEWTEAR